MRFFLLVSFILLAFSACSLSKPDAKQNIKPSCINNPNQNNYTGSVGIANIHYKGFIYQRKLAISRALDELALQKGVMVSLSMQKSEQVKNNKSSSNLETQSAYETSEAKLTAHIKDTWQDNVSKTLFIWLVLD